MNTGKNLSRRSTLRGAMVIALTAIPTLVTKVSASAAGSKIVKLSKLPVGGTFSFTTKGQGIPAIAFRTKTGVFAYSMICTHQGCTVSYNKSAKKLACPCHGAQFDPLDGAKPVAGPADSPLASIKVAVKGGWVVEA
jgi:nitrite reductase/ring-hydroxylating ferredoxin subunit